MGGFWKVLAHHLLLTYCVFATLHDWRKKTYLYNGICCFIIAGVSLVHQRGFVDLFSFITPYCDNKVLSSAVGSNLHCEIHPSKSLLPEGDGRSLQKSH